MYTVAVQRDFIARHFLIGGDWGEENTLHAHHYVVALILEGATLDGHGYLADICEVESVLENLIADYRDQVLNELPVFKGNNPSLELFASIISSTAAPRIQADNLTAFTVKIWETETAWAAYRHTF